MKGRYELRIRRGAEKAVTGIAEFREAAPAMAEANTLTSMGGHVFDSGSGWTYYPLAGWISPDGETQLPSYRLPPVRDVAPQIPKLS
jgi:hypothetical protein